MAHFTKNEVEHARAQQHHYMLIVVSGIRADKKDGSVTATGGHRRVLHPWAPREEDLEALSYRCQLPDA